MDNDIKEYWNKDDVESMYDKNLLNLEIELIKQHIPPDSKVLDAGCGEGEGALEYSEIPGIVIHAADFSETRLRKAEERLKNRLNVVLKQVDFSKRYSLDKDYDCIISQRFLINLMEWSLQKKVLLDLMTALKLGGKLLMLEGSKEGADSLNEFRLAWGLEPLDVKWHNLYFDDHELVKFMQSQGFSLVEEDGLGAYFLLTRGLRPIFDKQLNWDCEFNRLAASRKMKDLLKFNAMFSRLKLWVFQKCSATD
jgi:ubiquinone/menaquinone biosynthesis C-methylase UbiE